MAGIFNRLSYTVIVDPPHQLVGVGFVQMVREGSFDNSLVVKKCRFVDCEAQLIVQRDPIGVKKGVWIDFRNLYSAGEVRSFLNVSTGGQNGED